MREFVRRRQVEFPIDSRRSRNVEAPEVVEQRGLSGWTQHLLAFKQVQVHSRQRPHFGQADAIDFGQSAHAEDLRDGRGEGAGATNTRPVQIAGEPGKCQSSRLRTFWDALDTSRTAVSRPWLEAATNAVGRSSLIPRWLRCRNAQRAEDGSRSVPIGGIARRRQPLLIFTGPGRSFCTTLM